VLGKTAGKDETVHKATYVKLLGLERSKMEAQKLVDDAKALLDQYGFKANPLKAIADYVVHRKN
jgi:geranylgeranyl diphosphate synthase type II